DAPKEITLLLVLLDPQYKKLKFVIETQCNIAVDKLKESNDNLSNNLSKPSLTNKPSNVNQVNYSLLGLSDDSDEEESNISNIVICYFTLPKEAQE
ncbi:14383_t:CDS:2, partial [Gigaspora margarita]